MAIKKKQFARKDSKPKGKNIFQNAVDYLKESEEKIKADQKKQFVFFILGFLLFYLLISFFVGLVPQMFFKQITGESVQGMLAIQGIVTQNVGTVLCTEFSWIIDSVQDSCYSFLVNDSTGQEKTIIISWLCTGVLEIIILMSAILASFGVSWKKKIIGALVAIPAGIVFNLIRIWITVNLILGQNVETIELAHDFLFRIMLFIYVVIFYVLWFYWAEGKIKK